jgi:hypothetical protein
MVARKDIIYTLEEKSGFFPSLFLSFWRSSDSRWVFFAVKPKKVLC